MKFYSDHHLPIGHQGPFFMQKATVKIMVKRSKEGNFRKASNTVKFKNCTFDRYVKSLAVKCGFTNAIR